MFRGVLALLLLASACTAGETDVAPPRYAFYYPSGITVSPSERYLFAISANSDLRYSGGTISAVDLDRVEEMTSSWLSTGAPPAGCRTIPERPKVVTCPTVDQDGVAAPFMVQRGTVKIGNFGVALGVQVLDGASRLRLFATVRGDPSVTWIDFDESTGTADCGDNADYPRCSPEHRLTRLYSDAGLQAIPPEPFYVYVDGDNENVFAAHLTSGAVTLVDAPRGTDSTPVIHDIDQSFWSPVGQFGVVGAVGVAARDPGDPGGLIYVSSRQESRVAVLRVASSLVQLAGRPLKALSRTLPMFVGGTSSSGLIGDARGVAFSGDGDRFYLVSRVPPSLQVFDTSLDHTGTPRNQFIGVVELCEQPAMLAVADFGQGTRIALPCFATGQVWIVDPERLAVVAGEDVGRGPNGVAVSLSRKRIYVANYAEDTIAVVDATPGAVTENRLVLRIGEPRSLEQ